MSSPIPSESDAAARPRRQAGPDDNQISHLPFMSSSCLQSHRTGSEKLHVISRDSADSASTAKRSNALVAWSRGRRRRSSRSHSSRRRSADQHLSCAQSSQIVRTSSGRQSSLWPAGRDDVRSRCRLCPNAARADSARPPPHLKNETSCPKLLSTPTHPSSLQECRTSPHQSRRTSSAI